MFRVPNDVSDERILFVALNWGDGHVTRSIPLIQKLQSQGNQFWILASPEQKRLYSHYLSDVHFLPWDGFPFQFKGLNNFALELSLRLVSLAKAERLLRKEVIELHHRFGFQRIICDHIYGLNLPDLPSVFITHQYNLPLSFGLSWVNAIHHKKVKAYDQIWILDNEASELAGKLSESNAEKKCVALGWPSRFSSFSEKEKKYQTFLLTGPEPYRSRLMAEFIPYIEQTAGLVAIVGVNSEEKAVRLQKDVLWVDRIDQEKIDEVLSESNLVYSRGGYTTYLDQKHLAFEMVNFPTPGQHEQVYLNLRHKKKASK